ncbi:hypothetical protein RHGRI_028722 [Rhododendron griersonianum]|uniref:Uncharacterized protein n=1 Tax=Rhododendron griersonianum TaxID=479676 RepID=A0AAV6IHB7_9ERIC|nr:hypothetical protein RHGRI_028722 [Rhododendron griersonianum]KAG5527886.1 hypothetical protein RHGRI_028722 [Rhododendron griersonianum]KAG5527887.1 hypothetical protein RHGRI_028722 [Rhododendron griersonianum]
MPLLTRRDGKSPAGKGEYLLCRIRRVDKYPKKSKRKAKNVEAGSVDDDVADLQSRNQQSVLDLGLCRNRREVELKTGSISETHIEPGPRRVVPNPSHLHAHDRPHRHHFFLHMVYLGIKLLRAGSSNEPTTPNDVGTQ